MSAFRQLSFPVRAVRYFRDPAVSIWRKLVAVLAVLYVVMPFDAIPDFIPVLGWLDDLGVLATVAYFFIREINAHKPAAQATVDALPRTDDGSTNGGPARF